MSITRILLVILVCYALILLAALRLHLSYGPPISQETIGLFIVFAMSSALIGLFSLAGALGALRYSIGMGGLMVGSAFLLKLWIEFAAWSPGSVWEMIQIGIAQFICLVLGFALARVRGYRIVQFELAAQSPVQVRFTVNDLLILTLASAVLFAVLGSETPVISGRIKWLMIYAAGGTSAALVVAAATWLCFGTRWTAVRLFACLLIAPIGGLVYAFASRYARLLYSWQWFAGVTVLQMILIVVPLTLMRMRGFRYTHA